MFFIVARSVHLPFTPMKHFPLFCAKKVEQKNMPLVKAFGGSASLSKACKRELAASSPRKRLKQARLLAAPLHEEPQRTLSRRRERRDSELYFQATKGWRAMRSGDGGLPRRSQPPGVVAHCARVFGSFAAWAKEHMSCTKKWRYVPSTGRRIERRSVKTSAKAGFACLEPHNLRESPREGCNPFRERKEKTGLFWPAFSTFPVWLCWIISPQSSCA